MNALLDRAGAFIRGVAREFRHAREWRLSTKIMVGFLLVAMAAIFAYSKQSEARTTEVITRAQNNLLATLAQNVGIQVQSQVLGYRRESTQVATDPEVVNFIGAGQAARTEQGGTLLRSLANALNADPDYRLLLVIDTHGKVVISNDAGLQGEDVSGEEYFSRGLAATTEEPYISDVVRSGDGRSQSLYVAEPVRDPMGGILGVIAIRFSPEHLAALLRDLPQEHRNGFLVSRDGVILANSADPSLNYLAIGTIGPGQVDTVRRRFGLARLDSLHQDDLATHFNGTRPGGYTEAHLLKAGETDVIGWSRVPGSVGWTVLVSEDQAYFTQDVTDLSRQQFLSALVLALIIGGLVIFAGRLFESTERESLSDPLTGLANRRFLQEILLRELRRAQRAGHPVSMIIADIDHFKSINDTFGHNIGDEVLEQVAGIMLSSVRATDFVVRYGGEEFVVLMPETRAYDASQVAEKLRTTIGDTVMESSSRPGITLKVTISAGIASYPVDGESGEEVILKADKALYWAKQNGRNRVAGAGDLGGPAPRTVPAEERRSGTRR